MNAHTFVNGILPIIVGIIFVLYKNRILDYMEKRNERNNIKTERELLSKKLLIITLFLILVGIIVTLKSL